MIDALFIPVLRDWNFQKNWYVCKVYSSVCMYIYLTYVCPSTCLSISATENSPPPHPHTPPPSSSRGAAAAGAYELSRTNIRAGIFFQVPLPISRLRIQEF